MSEPLHRRCPECNCEVFLVTGKRSGISWFQHPDSDCIYEDWNLRIKFKSREEAMKTEKIFEEVKAGEPAEPKAPSAPKYAI